MRKSLVRAFMALAAILALTGCQTEPGPLPAPRVPLLTADEAATELAALEKVVPAKPKNPALAREWDNLHVYLRKAKFLHTSYRPSEYMLDKISRDIANAEQSFRAIQSGQPLPLVPGEREEGYYSDNDRSFQPFLRYLPPAATKGRPMPMVVYLHGYSPYLNLVNWADFPSNLVEFARAEGFCLVAPFGRSNTDFQGIGEQDVLNAMAEMEARYPIDKDRIILAGISMGGMGVWTIGAHYPDRFAGLLVLGGRGDYYFWKKEKRQDLPAYKQRLIDTEFAASLLPNLRNIPIFCAHGTDDSLVPVAEARHIIAAVQKINPNVVYTEITGEDHWIFETMFGRKETRQWMKTCRRRTPTEFTYRTYHPKYNQCYWISGMDLLRDTVPAEVAVRVVAGKLSIAAAGVRGIEISKDQMPRSIRDLPVAQSGKFHIRYDGPATLRAASGPVKEAFLSPFVFVFAGDTNNTNDLSQFRQRSAEWYQYAKALPRVAYEKGFSAQELASCNVFLFGEPEGSALIRAVLNASPIRVTADEYVVGVNKFPRKGNGLCFVYRSPWNAARLAVVQCGIPWGEGLGTNHRYDLLPDYIVYSSARDTDGSNHALCAGFWDEEWKIETKASP